MTLPILSARELKVPNSSLDRPSAALHWRLFPPKRTERTVEIRYQHAHERVFSALWAYEAPMPFVRRCVGKAVRRVNSPVCPQDAVLLARAVASGDTLAPWRCAKASSGPENRTQGPAVTSGPGLDRVGTGFASRLRSNETTSMGLAAPNVSFHKEKRPEMTLASFRDFKN
jgi:hypothetical protein